MFRPLPKRTLPVINPQHPLPGMLCLYVSDDGIATGYHAHVDQPLGKDIIIFDQGGYGSMPALIGRDFNHRQIWLGNQGTYLELDAALWGLVRTLGRTYKELISEGDLAHLSLAQGCHGEVQIKFAGTSLTPEEWLALLLREARNAVVSQMGALVFDVILVHEASLDLQQQEDLRRAAQLVGWQVQRLVRQSIAAAMGFLWRYHPKRKGMSWLDCVPKSHRSKSLRGSQRLLVAYIGRGGSELAQVELMDEDGVEVLWVESDPDAGVHQLDHLFAQHLRKYLNPMGASKTEVEISLWSHLLRVAASVREHFSDHDAVSSGSTPTHHHQIEVYLENERPQVIKRAEWMSICAPFFEYVERFWRRCLEDSDIHLDAQIAVLSLGAVHQTAGFEDAFSRVFGMAGARGRAFSGTDDRLILHGGIAYAGFHSNTTPNFLLLDVSNRALYIDAMEFVAGEYRRKRYPCVEMGTTLPNRVTIALQVRAGHEGALVVEVFDSASAAAKPVGCYHLDLAQCDDARELECEIEMSVDQIIRVRISVSPDNLSEQGYLPWPSPRAGTDFQLPVRLPSEVNSSAPSLASLSPSPPNPNIEVGGGSNASG